MKKLLAFAAILSFSAFPAKAQLDQIQNLLQGSQEDANYLMNGYMAPVLQGIGNGLNQGWYNTARPHKFLGFDATVTLSVITIPTAEQTFQVDNSRLQSIQMISPADGKMPTIVGPEQGAQFQFKAPLSGTINGPGGVPGMDQLPVRGIPIPIANVGIGLFKGTEVKVRYVPPFTSGEGASINLMGGAIQHDIKQHIPVIKSLPFDLSVLVGYTKFDASYTIDPALNQEATVSATAMTAQAIVSKKLAILTVYAAAGYNKADVSLAAKGQYEMASNGVTTFINDPVNLTSASSGARLTGGVRLRLAILNLHADYTLQKYPTISAGVGVGIR